MRVTPRNPAILACLLLCAASVLTQACTADCPTGDEAVGEADPACGSANEASDVAALTQGDTSDDDPNTPGDERVGYVYCENVASGAGLTCAPGLGCCPMPTPTCGTFDSCAAANGGHPMSTFSPCDGPEDCSDGEQCWLEKGGTMCASSGGYNVKCHVDTDCPQGRPHCQDDGVCGVDPGLD